MANVTHDTHSKERRMRKVATTKEELEEMVKYREAIGDRCGNYVITEELYEQMLWEESLEAEGEEPFLKKK